jgi:hypothetical protein
MKISELRSTSVGYGRRMIIEDDRTVRIEVLRPVGTFDTHGIWEFKYLTGPRRGEIRSSYSLKQMYCSRMPSGRLVPAGRRIED